MNNASGVKKTSRKYVHSTRSQIHSGSLLAGMVGGALLAIALIAVTSQSRLSAKIQAPSGSTLKKSSIFMAPQSLLV